MRSIRPLLALTLLLATLVAPSARADGVRYRDMIFTSVTTTTDIAYGESIDNFGVLKTLLLDLYAPAGDTEATRPAFLWVHGGGFKTGNKSSGRSIATEFAKRGYVTASIGYRLRPPGTPNSSSNQELIAQFATGGEPDQIKDARYDVQAAVRWVRANATTLGVDPARIIVGGGSAGAVTALGINHDAAEDPGDSNDLAVPSTISAAVSFSGAWMATHIAPGDSPEIMFHGTNDVTVPFAFAAVECAGQTALLNTCEPHFYPGEGHGLAGVDDTTMRAMVADFLCRHVAGC